MLPYVLLKLLDHLLILGRDHAEAISAASLGYRSLRELLLDGAQELITALHKELILLFFFLLLTDTFLDHYSVR